jgi:transcriptional regulator with XRE-family HTH domain
VKKVDDLTSRCAWAIKTIPAEKDLALKISDVALAKILGTDKNTISRYRQGKGPPSGKVINNLIAHYKFNPMWLFKGEGEPYPGARNKYKEVCGPTELSGVYDTMAGYGTAAPQSPPAQSQEFRISDAIIMCTRVLESGTSYATALYFNIQHFDRAVNSEIFGKKCQDDLRIVGNSIAKMQTRMDGLEKENRNLQEEIGKLKGSSGGSAPTNLSPDNAAPTGTEDQAT